MGWTMPLQQAAYRGVRFDVLNVTDSFERAIAEHSYPFVNGADLEDMGLQPRRVQLQAVFFGEGYQIPMNKLVVALYAQGADVLVHPVFGRMPNMICQSASLRHGDEFVDYVALDLTFVEVSEGKPIFVFDSALWSVIDKALSKLEGVVDEVLALYAEFMKGAAQFGYAKARLLKAWSSLAAVYESVLSMFDFDGQYRISAGVSVESFSSNSVKAMSELNEVITQSLMQIAFPQLSRAKQVESSHTVVNTSQVSDAFITPLFGSSLGALIEAGEEDNELFVALTVRSRFDEVLRQVNTLKSLPKALVSGKNDSVKRAKAEKLNTLVSGVKWVDMQDTASAIELIATIALARIGVQMIEQSVDNLLPAEIEYITRQIRLSIAETISSLRKLQTLDMRLSAGNTAKPNTGVYTQSHLVIEEMRDLAHSIAQLAIAAINRKPPLMVRQSRVNGTIHQVAHDFYGDYRRADELLRLNPQIRQPNFIAQGELINAYSK